MFRVLWRRSWINVETICESFSEIEHLCFCRFVQPFHVLFSNGSIKQSVRQVSCIAGLDISCQLEVGKT